MILAVGIGNGEIALGAMEGLEPIAVASVSASLGRTADEYAVLLRDLLALRGVDLSRLDGVMVSSVVPPLTDRVMAALRSLGGARVRLLGVGMKTGLNILIDDPSQLGGDLVASAVGASARYGAPTLLIDCGVATTFSVLGEGGAYLGCAIAPGIELSAAALAASASLLPEVAGGKPSRAIGRTTAESMLSGSLFGTVALLDGMIRRLEGELGKPFSAIIASGSAVRSVLPLCEREIIYDDTLLFRGLAMIYERSMRK